MGKRFEGTAPVTHGHWVVKNETYGENFCCSECGSEYTVGVEGGDLMQLLRESARFCPCCGARMDGEIVNDGG